MLNKKNTFMAATTIMVLGVGATNIAQAHMLDRFMGGIKNADVEKVTISMASAIEAVQTAQEGAAVIEIELDKEGDKLFYEVEVIKADSEAHYLVDAMTGEITADENRGRKKDRRGHRHH